MSWNLIGDMTGHQDIKSSFRTRSEAVAASERAVLDGADIQIRHTSGSALSLPDLKYKIENKTRRHLVYLFDGTWATASHSGVKSPFSNIYRLNTFLELYNPLDEAQLRFYMPGLGSQTLGRKYLGGAMAWGLEKIVEQAYVNICANYCPAVGAFSADKIYLFGFSRGAIVARILASLIQKCGIIYPEHMQSFPFLWAYYLGQPVDSGVKKFVSEHSHQNVEIEFLGLFDSVVGLYRSSDAVHLRKLLLLDRSLPSNVRTCLHLVASHERRRLFRPLLFTHNVSTHQKLEQVWMPGVHTDVGGGYPMDLISNVALASMIDRISLHTDLQPDIDRWNSLLESIEDGLDRGKTVINNELVELWSVLPTYLRQPHMVDHDLVHEFFHRVEGDNVSLHGIARLGMEHSAMALRAAKFHSLEEAFS